MVALNAPGAATAAEAASVHPELRAADGAPAITDDDTLELAGTVPAGATNPRARILKLDADGTSRVPKTVTVSVDASGRIAGSATTSYPDTTTCAVLEVTVAVDGSDTTGRSACLPV